MYYGIENFKDYLMHHGREGQKWGVRNGPPYPLAGKFADSVRKYKEHQKHKRRTKILNDPKKLYKHRSEFTEDEIRDATSKAQAVSELKRQIPQSERKKKEISRKKMSLVDTPTKFKRNQKFLTEKEQQQAIDYLYKQDKADEFNQNKLARGMRTVDKGLDIAQNLGRTAGSVVKTIDSIKSLSPDYIPLSTRGDLALAKELFKLGEPGFKLGKALGLKMNYKDWFPDEKETKEEKRARQLYENETNYQIRYENFWGFRDVVRNAGVDPDTPEGNRMVMELVNRTSSNNYDPNRNKRNKHH